MLRDPPELTGSYPHFPSPPLCRSVLSVQRTGFLAALALAATLPLAGPVNAESDSAEVTLTAAGTAAETGITLAPRPAVTIDAAPAPLRFEIGRAHVRTPVTNAHLVCRPLLEKTKKTTS